MHGAKGFSRFWLIWACVYISQLSWESRHLLRDIEHAHRVHKLPIPIAWPQSSTSYRDTINDFAHNINIIIITSYYLFSCTLPNTLNGNKLYLLSFCQWYPLASLYPQHVWNDGQPCCIPSTPLRIQLSKKLLPLTYDGVHGANTHRLCYHHHPSQL